jgi:hypothetical protein
MFLDAYTKSLRTIRNKNIVANHWQNLLMGFLNAGHWSDWTRRWMFGIYSTCLKPAFDDITWTLLCAMKVGIREEEKGGLILPWRRAEPRTRQNMASGVRLTKPSLDKSDFFGKQIGPVTIQVHIICQWSSV